MMRSSVVLPQPEGPTSAATAPAGRANFSPRSTSSRPPDAARYDLLSMLTSSWAGPPAGDMSFNRLHQECFDRQHDDDEGNSIGEDAGNVEQLEGDPDFEADAVGPAQQFDDEDDLPHQRQPRARRRGEIGGELRNKHVPQPRPVSHVEHVRHLVELAVERA